MVISQKVRYRLFLIFTLVIVTTIMIICEVSLIKSKLPDKINLVKNQTKVIDFNLPLTGEISSNAVSSVNFSSPVAFKAGEVGNFELNLKLFGLFHLQTMSINVIDETQLIPCGIPVGIYIKTNGILVINTGNVIDDKGKSVSPSEGKLKAGDYIFSVNNHEVSNKSQFSQLINECDGADITLGIRRGNENIYVTITPTKDASGGYKLGTWIKDDSQGIGTLTYIDSKSCFGALGHGISDSDTGMLLKLDNGILYNAQIMSIVKGNSGTPGEFVGTIDYNSKNQLGSITSNTNHGIFGEINSQSIIDKYDLKPLAIGYKYDVTKGGASIRTYVENEIKDYSIEITDIKIEDAGAKNITFKVTDEALLSITNGIVQGMSGSPIIQNDKIIGAVTHVFVDDSSMGYGIFIETMLSK